MDDRISQQRRDRVDEPRGVDRLGQVDLKPGRARFVRVLAAARMPSARSPAWRCRRRAATASANTRPLRACGCPRSTRRERPRASRGARLRAARPPPRTRRRARASRAPAPSRRRRPRPPGRAPRRAVRDRAPTAACRTAGRSATAGRFVDRQRDGERRALPCAAALGADAAAVQLDEVADDAEAEAEPRLAARPRVRLAEPLEDVRQKRREMPTPVSATDSTTCRSSRFSRTAMRPEGCGELDRVPRRFQTTCSSRRGVAEDERRLGQTRVRSRPASPRPAAAPASSAASTTSRAAPARERCAGASTRCARRRAGRRSTGVCARALRSMTAMPCRTRSGGTSSALQHLRPSEDRGQRRAQLVRDRREELVLRAVRILGLATRGLLLGDQLREVVPHRVERACRARGLPMARRAESDDRTGPSAACGRMAPGVSPERRSIAPPRSDRIAPIMTNQAPRTIRSARRRSAGASASS